MTSKNKRTEVLESLYDRSKKLMTRLNLALQYEEPLRDSVVIADVPRAETEKSYDTVEKAQLMEYSLNGNGSIIKNNDSISNSLLDSQINGKDFDIKEGKNKHLSDSDYDTLYIKFGKIMFKTDEKSPGKNAFNNNDIFYLESKIPVFKKPFKNQTVFDSQKKPHQFGSDEEDSENQLNFNVVNLHKIDLSQENIEVLENEKIEFFLTRSGVRPKKNGRNKDEKSTVKDERNEVPVGKAVL